MTAMKRTFSIILAVFMLVSAIPFTASAAEPIALTESNVTVWPTAIGEIYFGQKLSDGITLSGGEVQYNGAVVSGKFDFIDTNYMPTSAGNQIASIKFVPSDTQNYNGFEVQMAWDVTYKVNKTIPVLVSETDLPIATEVEAGAALSTSTLSGGQVKNPYNESESKALAAKWRWTKTSTIVNESGYYQARMVIGTAYEVIYQDVYVKIAGETPETSITEYPTISELTYDPNVTWADIPLEGGKAVIKGTETEVEGTFAIKDTRKDVVPNPNFTEIEVVFTPANAEEALPNEFKIPVTVNPSPLTFVDDEGNPVEDFTFEVEPGTKMNDIKALITTNLRVPKNAVISVEDNYGYAQNGRKYKLTVLHDDPYYTGKELYFTVSFKETEITPSLKWVGAGKLKVDCGEYSPPGSFAVYYVIGETETKIGDVKGNSEILEWTPTSSGDYGFKVVYNPIENDYFIIESVTTTPYSYYPEHKVISTGNMVATHKMGEAVTVTAVPTDPEKAKTPFYGFKGWTDVKGNTGLTNEDLESAEITFTMPDGDVELTASYAFSFLMLLEYIYSTLVNFFASVVNSIATLF